MLYFLERRYGSDLIPSLEIPMLRVILWDVLTQTDHFVVMRDGRVLKREEVIVDVPKCNGCGRSSGPTNTMLFGICIPCYRNLCRGKVGTFNQKLEMVYRGIDPKEVTMILNHFYVLKNGTTVPREWVCRIA